MKVNEKHSECMHRRSNALVMTTSDEIMPSSRCSWQESLIQVHLGVQNVKKNPKNHTTLTENHNLTEYFIEYGKQPILYREQHNNNNTKIYNAHIVKH